MQAYPYQHAGRWAASMYWNCMYRVAAVHNSLGPLVHAVGYEANRGV